MKDPRLVDFTTLTFDCYGTLIDWESGIAAELIPWAAGHGLNVSEEDLLGAFADLESKCQAATPGKKYSKLLEDVLERIAARFSVSLASGEAEDFGGSVQRWPAFPDSTEALQYLSNHYRLVILSNVDRDSFAASERTLGVTFDRVVTAEDVGSYKPNPRNFEYLLTDLRDEWGTESAEILHTAQSLFHDMVPASNAGLRTIWINRRRGLSGWGATPPPPAPVRPDWEVGSMREFAAMHRREVEGEEAGVATGST